MRNYTCQTILALSVLVLPTFGAAQDSPKPTERNTELIREPETRTDKGQPEPKFETKGEMALYYAAKAGRLKAENNDIRNRQVWYLTGGIVVGALTTFLIFKTTPED